MQYPANKCIVVLIMKYDYCIYFRSSDGVGSSVYLHGDPRSASVTELWQTPLPTSSSRDPQIDDVAPVRMGYQPPNRVCQKSSRSVVKNREQVKPQNHRKSKGENASIRTLVSLCGTCIIYNCFV